MPSEPNQQYDRPDPNRPGSHTNMILLSMGGKPVRVDIGNILYGMHSVLGRTKVNTLLGNIHRCPFEQRVDKFQEILKPVLNPVQINHVVTHIQAQVSGGDVLLSPGHPIWKQPESKFSPPIPWPIPKELKPPQAQ